MNKSQGLIVLKVSLFVFAVYLFFQQVWLYFRVGLTDQPSRVLGLITLTETLIKRDITKSETNNCFIINCLKDNIDKHTIAGTSV